MTSFLLILCWKDRLLLYLHPVKWQGVCVCVCDVACVSGEYLVKWQGLPYSECTQEDVDLIKHHFPVAVEEYNRRRKTSRLPSKNCKVSK